jgi:integrase
MRDLVKRLIEDYPSEGVGGAVRLVARLVQFHNFNAKPELKLPLPEISARAPRPKNPFDSQRWGGLARVAHWREEILHEIQNDGIVGSKHTDGSTGRESNLNYGRALASAVLWGGLISRSSLEALYEILPNWNVHCTVTHGRPVVTWTEKGGNYRRWLPDPLTALLIFRLPIEQQKAPLQVQTKNQDNPANRSRMERDLLAYMDHAIRNREPVRRTLHRILDATKLHLEVRLPRALVRYASGDLVSHSLRPDTWDGLMKGVDTGALVAGACLSEGFADTAEDEELETVDQGEIQSEPAEREEERTDPAEEDRQPKWLYSLRDMLRPQGGRTERERIRKIAKGWPKQLTGDPAFLMFAGFAKDQLDKSASARKGNQLKTIQAKVIALASRLPALVNFTDPAFPDAETLQPAYQLILEDATSTNQREKLANYIRAFHDFLAAKFEADKIDDRETFASVGDDLAVDANLVSEDEFQIVLEILRARSGTDLEERSVDQDFHFVAMLLLILGYRAGMRRMEALKLQLTAFNEQDPAELLVKPWAERRLKTPNATRKLPLYALVPDDELQTLKAWKARREEQNKQGTSSPFFFAIPAVGLRSLPEKPIFELVHNTLRSVTHRPTRFHHLRHALASWLALALLKPQGAKNFPLLKNCPMTQRRVNDEGLIARLYGNSHSSRRHLYCISRILGHSAADLSCEIYISTFDQLLALWLELEAPLKDVEFWAAASGYSTPTIYRNVNAKYGRPLATSDIWGLVEMRGKKERPKEPKSRN